ncbi:MAG: YbhB/YbcL family Raf kinase inhibitor-like protein [Alphaproteobacteria bacterium]|nr:YbhB/YbcL family Raf kinase inhibitor-like protein [Alphaproteobacteria bacterium]
MRLMFLVFLGMAVFAGCTSARAEMVLSSESIQEQGMLSMDQVFNGFGCQGKNLSPQLSWEGAPEGTKSLAVTIYDPDAPTGSGWWHWVAFNMPADTQGLAEGASGASMPEGTVESRTDFGSIGFGGACPPVGDKPHRYIVSVFALDTDRLDLDAQTPAAQVGYYLNAHTIEKAVLTGLYSR